MPKTMLRRFYKKQRDKLHIDDIKINSRIIFEKLVSLPIYKKSNIIMCYFSFGSETFTHEFIEDALKSGRVLAVPRVDAAINTITPIKITNLSDCTFKNCYGINEPIHKITEIIEPAAFDIIIVPGISFDIFGNRLGFGDGYYDKFLSSNDIKATKIGICFDFQIANAIPIENHDVKMDMVLTDRREFLI